MLTKMHDSMNSTTSFTFIFHLWQKLSFSPHMTKKKIAYAIYTSVASRTIKSFTASASLSFRVVVLYFGEKGGWFT
jgi:hypothetical protein